MFSIFEPTCLLLIVIAHHPLNTFGGTIHEDSSLEIVDRLQNEIELMKKDNESINITIKVNIELQKSKLDDFLNGGRMQNETDGSLIERSNQDNVSEIPSELRNNDVNFNCITNCSSTNRSCDEALTANNFEEDVYLLKESKSDLNPFYVNCIHGDEPKQGWMVIQRRHDGSVDFERTWLDYKLGFGDLDGEYWIGLERLHQITSSKPHELWIVAYNLKMKKLYAKYSKFIVGSENEGYKLTVGGYSGDIGDVLAYQNSMKFTTIDNDNDELEDANCALMNLEGGGGWWYKDCEESLFNGRYFENGIRLYFNYRVNKLRKVFMAIRPK